MSLAGILASSLFSSNNTQGASQYQQINSEFQQLGQDLSAGNLSQAQQDFATLTQTFQGQQQANVANGNNPVAQAFTALSNDLQSGNLTAAQQDFTTLQQDLQQQLSSAIGHHRHRFNGGGNAQSGSSTQNNPIAQVFAQLGQALQSGNLSSAQQAYTTLQQDFEQFTASFASGGGSTAASGTTNVTA